MIDEKSISLILDSKEDRRIFQTKLIEQYKNTLITFTLNIPGAEKDNEEYRKIHRQAMDYILKSLEGKKIKLLHDERFEKSTGPEGYILVEKSALDIKLFMIEIEEGHALGRLFDIDVFDKKNRQVTRKDLNIEARKCLICKEDARVCMRERKHSQDELLDRVDEIIKGYCDLTIKEYCEIIDV